MKLIIERLGHHGDGIATGEAGPIYVPGCLPDEEVEGDLVKDILTNVRIISPSPNRVKPPCAHARSCGGCLMQHAGDPFVASWKEAIVKGALAGQGLTAPFRPIITSPARSRRRATLAARKTKGGVLMGFHTRASDTIVPVPNCQLLHPDLIAAFPALETLVKLGGSRTVEVQLTVTRSLAGADVAVTGGKPLEPELQMEMARLCETHKIARLTWNGETVAMRAAPVQRFGHALVAPPPGAFLQATAEGESALLQSVALAIGSARKLVDLFAGSGTFSIPLAERAEVHAVEGDAKMIAALDKGARNAEGLRRLTTETRDLFRRPLEPDEFKGVEAVVIDPPRAGAEAQVRELAASKVGVVAYVSCNPVTFARDARILVDGGLKCVSVTPVDQFKWTAHVELVGVFGR